MTISAPAASPATTSSSAPDDTVVVNGKREIPSFDDPDGPSFSDLLDVLNPLQHIPIVNTIYQHLTGDKEGAVADMAGGLLWGGPIGLGAAVANLVVESITGKSISDNALALVSDDENGQATADAAPDTSSQTAKAAEPTPIQVSDLSPISTAAAAEVPAAAAAPATTAGQNGPTTMGDFLVFGADSGAGTAVGALAQANRQVQAQTAASQAAVASLDQAATQPVSLTPREAARTDGPRARAIPAQPGMSAAAAVLAAQAAQTQTADAQSATLRADRPKDGINRAGDFLVFGAGEPAATALPPVSAAPGPQRAEKTAGANDQPAGRPATTTQDGAAPVQLTPANQNQVAQQMAARAASRAYAAPQRRNAVPPQNLPMPTTGPAAVPGSQAPSQARADGGTAWFSSAFNQAMDKYDRSRNLADANQTAGSSTVH